MRIYFTWNRSALHKTTGISFVAENEGKLVFSQSGIDNLCEFIEYFYECKRYEKETVVFFWDANQVAEFIETFGCKIYNELENKIFTFSQFSQRFGEESKIAEELVGEVTGDFESLSISEPEEAVNLLRLVIKTALNEAIFV